MGEFSVIKHLCAVAALLTVATGTVRAATVTWAAPQNQTGTTADLLSAGSLYAAITYSSPVTYGGISFVNPGAGVPISVANVGFYGARGVAPPASFETGYRRLIGDTVAGSGGSPSTITISGLTVGQSYAVQMWLPFWDSNWATAFTGGANTSALVNAAGPNQGAGAASVAQFITGSFVADTTSQLITMSSPTSYRMLSAMQVRSIDASGAVPEPATWATMLIGFGAIGYSLRRRARAHA